MDFCIHEILPAHIEQSAKVVRAAFLTVAAEFGFTEENNPTNGAFLKAEKLKADYLNGVKMFGLYKEEEQVGFVALEKKENKLYYLEKLAVLPSCRHNGYGAHLVHYVKEDVRKTGGGPISIGIINENTRLKKWYEQQGFVETGCKKFAHLTFTVCFMTLTV